MPSLMATRRQPLCAPRCTGSNGVAIAVDGGAPMLLDGNITLCARADLNSSRFFDGALCALLLRCRHNSAVTAHVLRIDRVVLTQC